MHTDARTLENGSLLEGDLCIVGAGAAGISMAMEWVGTPKRVILLEGGGFDMEVAMQDLYRGEIVGKPYFPLEAARLHYFGGTTNHWAGLCSTFDAIDFEKRDWVPHSGWPIKRAELDAYYPRAGKVLDLATSEWNAAYYEAQDPRPQRLPLDANAVWPKMWQFSGPTRMGRKYRDAIVAAPNVHLFTHANVVEVEANASAHSVTGLRARTLEGKEVRVRARDYVLACCSLQNARLLLASNRQSRAGLGNAHDVVGRYFMEHLEMPGGQIVLAPGFDRYTALYTGNRRSASSAELALGPKVQRDRRMLNGTASLRAVSTSTQVKSTFQTLTPEVLDAFVRREKGDTTADEVLRKAFADFHPPAPGERTFQLFSRQEQAPNPASRVTLGAERDAMGMPRVRFDWQLTELDKRSMRTYYEELGREVGRAGVGRVQVMDWLIGDDRTWPDFLSGGWHHMGTTRMHQDPKQGVVDAHSRVHGIANLHVAGASTFTTAGAVNPTLTLVALTLRLSDHLKSVQGVARTVS